MKALRAAAERPDQTLRISNAPSEVVKSRVSRVLMGILGFAVVFRGRSRCMLLADRAAGTDPGSQVPLVFSPHTINKSRKATLPPHPPFNVSGVLVQ